jgi:flagellar FliL protein
MKKILIALGALVVLGGGGAGAYMYFVKPAEASVSDEAAAAAEKLKAEKAAQKDSHGHGKGAAFLELDPLVLPIVDHEGVSQVVSLVVAIEVADDAAKKDLEIRVPHLKDAFIQEMYGALSSHAALKDGVLQVGYIKERLNAISTEILGADAFSGVLLQVVQQRPI